MEGQAHDLAAELAALCDTMLPGDARFPSATAAGAHGVAADRIRARAGEAGLDRVIEAMRACGGPLASAADRTAVVRAFETQHPELFGLVRLALFTAYYESPAVIRAIRALGHVYNAAPQPAGYDMPPFDPDDPLHAPRHRRGSYVPTAEVRRVDLSPLPPDPLAPEDYRQEQGTATGRGLLSTGTREEVRR